MYQDQDWIEMVKKNGGIIDDVREGKKLFEGKVLSLAWWNTVIINLRYFVADENYDHDDGITRV